MRGESGLPPLTGTATDALGTTERAELRTRALIDLSEELHDVDIFDITSPRKPRPIREYDMVESFPQVLGFGLYIFKYNPTHGDVERLSSRSCGMPR